MPPSIHETFIQAVLKLKKSSSSTPELDARLLMAHCLNVEPMQLNTRSDDVFFHDAFENFVAQRAAGKPVSKIIAAREFYGRLFTVTDDVLDPRPDSETGIEAVLSILPDRDKAYQILDLGTGSGCLLVTLLKEYPNAQGRGGDVSDKVLAVARKNAAKHNVEDRAEFRISNWFAEIEHSVDGTYDLIISNPPYIPRDEIENLAPDVKDFDPLSALEGGADGLRDYRIIAQDVRSYLKPDGQLLLEIGQGQETDVMSIFEAAGLTCQQHFKDLAGIVRYLLFKM